MQLKTFEIDSGYFDAAGKRYFIEDTLSFNRFEKLREYTLEMGFSATFLEIFNNLKKAWDLMNKQQPSDAAVVIHNIMNGIGRLEKKDDPAFRICALFCNTEDEDTTVWDEAVERQKIEDWGGEYNVTPFFWLAAAKVNGWLPAYKSAFQGISAAQPQEEDQNT
jgi:hypothetical protein